FEKIIVMMNPDTGVNIEKLEMLGSRERSLKKILIAEDSPMLRELLKDTLIEAGYDQLTFFENGKEAWDFLEKLTEDTTVPLEQNVDLIITDIEMPQMDGHHLTDKVKKDPHLHEIPLIIFSSLITNDL